MRKMSHSSFFFPVLTITSDLADSTDDCGKPPSLMPCLKLNLFRIHYMLASKVLVNSEGKDEMGFLFGM